MPKIVAAPLELTCADAFREHVARGEAPAVLRGGARHWGAVAAARAGNVSSYLRERDTGTPVYTIVGQPGIDGRFGFRHDTRSVNYDARQTPLGSVLDQLPQAAEGGFAVAVQAAPARELLRDWERDNPADLVTADAPPRLWISLPSRVAPHSDVHDNVAVVVAGSRRFTLFPPGQIDNLYLGPLLSSPGGVPTSSVDIWNPDASRHPRFSIAAATAVDCTLEPGDAIYIPSLWWHAVESLDELNILANYWFSDRHDGGLSLSDTLSHAMLSISSLPRAKRERWRRYFDYLVFRLDEDPSAHLPDDLEDLLSVPNSDQRERVRQRIAKNLSMPAASENGSAKK